MRKEWLELLIKIAEPVLNNCSLGLLKQNMPIESSEGYLESSPSAHLEAVARTLCGLAPWLEAEIIEPEEASLQQKYRVLAVAAIEQVVLPNGPDRCNFSVQQSIVDAAFLCHALLRAPTQIVGKLSPDTKKNLLAALESVRQDKRPWPNNWLLFGAMVEVGRDVLGESPDYMRIDYALSQHNSWYKGDGLFGDGPYFHMDYYNSFVIHPMLVDITERYDHQYPGWPGGLTKIIPKYQRFCEIQERMIGPDGHFPVVGRSLTYRAGAFQALAQAALQKRLPNSLKPAVVRCALNAVINRTLSVPGTFDDSGWLKIGLCGSQSGLGERYINTGSLYLCSTAFLPLGLQADDPFWTDESLPWTSKRVWQGVDTEADKSIN